MVSSVSRLLFDDDWKWWAQLLTPTALLAFGYHYCSICVRDPNFLDSHPMDGKDIERDSVTGSANNNHPLITQLENDS